MEWETTLDQAKVIETVSDDTLLFLQLHKRIWPAAQRDSCFWYGAAYVNIFFSSAAYGSFRRSHQRKVMESELPEGIHDTYLVCNRSTAHPDAPVNVNGVLRVDLTVIFVADTVVDVAKRGLDTSLLSRDDVSCKITYCSVVNPGGWAPASVLRTVYKREYPRFLKRFTSYVIDKCKHKPIMW